MDRLESVVIITDRGSQTFTKIGDSAQQMGASIDKAGMTGERGLSGLSATGAKVRLTFTALQGALSGAAWLS